MKRYNSPVLLTSQRRPKTADTQDQVQNADEAMRILSYLLAGIIFYGGLGWLGDYLLKTSWLLPLGLVVGTVVSIYLIMRRFGSKK